MRPLCALICHLAQLLMFEKRRYFFEGLVHTSEGSQWPWPAQLRKRCWHRSCLLKPKLTGTCEVHKGPSCAYNFWYLDTNIVWRFKLIISCLSLAICFFFASKCQSAWNLHAISLCAMPSGANFPWHVSNCSWFIFTMDLSSNSKNVMGISCSKYKRNI